MPRTRLSLTRRIYTLPALEATADAFRPFCGDVVIETLEQNLIVGIAGAATSVIDEFLNYALAG